MVTETSPQPRRRIGCLKKRDGTAATLSDSENEETGLFSKTSLGLGVLQNHWGSESEDDLASSKEPSASFTGNLLSANGRLDTNLFKGKSTLGFGKDISLLALSESDSESDQDTGPTSALGLKQPGKNGTKKLSKPSKSARILEMLGYESEEEETTQPKNSGLGVPVVGRTISDEPVPEKQTEAEASSSSSESSSEEENDQVAAIIKAPRKTKAGLKSATKRDLLEMHKETERLIRQTALAAPARAPKPTQKRLDMSAFLKKFQKPITEPASNVEAESSEPLEPELTSTELTSEETSIEPSSDTNGLEPVPALLPSKANTLAEFLMRPNTMAASNATAINLDKGKQVERQPVSHEPETAELQNPTPATSTNPSVTPSAIPDPFITNQANATTLSYQDSDSDSELEIIENPKDLAIQGLLKVVQKKPRKSPVKPSPGPNPAAFTSPSRIRGSSIVTQKQLNRKLLDTIQSQSAKRRIEDIERQLAKQYTPDKVIAEILSDEEGILLSGEDEEEDEDQSHSESEETTQQTEAATTTTDAEREDASAEIAEKDVDEENTTDDEITIPSSLRPRHKSSSKFKRVLSDDEGESSYPIESTIPTQPLFTQPKQLIDEEGFMINSLPRTQEDLDNDIPTQYFTEDGLFTLNAPTQETIPCTPSQSSTSATQIINSSLTAISQSPPHTWSRLQQGRPSGTAEPEDSKPMTELDAFALLGQAALNEHHKATAASMVTQLKPRNTMHSEFIDAEAEEEEDEFGFVGGEDEEEDEDDEDIVIPTLDEEEEFDHEDIKQLHLQQMKEKDRKDISNLMNDIATGGLRKRRRLGGDDGKGFDLDEDFSDEENLNRRSRYRLIKRRTDTDDFLDRIAQNPETAAFARAVAVEGNDADADDPFDHVADEAEDVFSMFRSNHSVSVEEIYSREMSMEVGRDTTTTAAATTTKSVSFDFTKEEDFAGRDQSILRLIKSRSAAPASVEDPTDEAALEPWMNTHQSGVSFLETNPDRVKRFVSMANDDKILGAVVARKEFNHKNMTFRSTTKSVQISKKKGKTPERPTPTKAPPATCGSAVVGSPTKVPPLARSETTVDPCPLLKSELVDAQ
ncbi:hypothetical protein K493DRAFT_357321 [Basidiobolus meristosporus CBS 931.73]|uniref:DNA replication checkpoint mediator MRC1 domain-containing protein n=1 Tax=Basidiobolus meristosporus CBS 931.73 TaxID=1314790 RepID=A0A1Y1XX65_9FUNG|nr:hypothetical protein K493DRAFT_357321 [Basidiobolus meristosporus CBS 931.73]|eukprot:ORX90076.1 hypothetical protein K493DRAFT_357321 [Basidiobolus meristosporus CBS 931.73]